MSDPLVGSSHRDARGLHIGCDLRVCARRRRPFGYDLSRS